MSEFKFACPVCGQHITADSSMGGRHIDCPTCFQKIVTPQAPTSPDTKLILSAAQVSKPRPTGAEAAVQSGPPQSPSPRTWMPVVVVLLALLCAAGAAVFVFRGRIFKSAAAPGPASTNRPPPEATTATALSTNYAVPTNIAWTLDLKNAVVPAAKAAGRIHGSGFVCERTTVQGGTLSLRQGKTWPPDLGITLLLPLHPGEELGGKTIEITPDQPRAPRVVVRWKDEQRQSVTETVRSGYALKLVFGEAANRRLPGRIYLCLPDAAQSFVAGTFDAEIRKPAPAKAATPPAAKPKG